jgi:drug/metabolite transporter (DMT)-like permease
VTHFLALLGVLSISFSAVFVRLSGVSPVTATFYRAAYAVPVLAGIWAWFREGDRRLPRARLLAFVSGIVLAMDLGFWHESIALIGVGLATVIANVQVVFVAIAAWVCFGERLSRRTAATIAVLLVGIALTSGLARHDAYGSNPVLGAVFGVLAGLCYAGFLITFRAASRTPAPTAGPLLDATIGTVVGALLSSPLDPRFAFAAPLEAHLWLVSLALVSQVMGWLLIGVALTRLPSVETSILLLVQPVFAVIWGMLIFSERLSVLQWVGAVLVVGGVACVRETRKLEIRT